MRLFNIYPFIRKKFNCNIFSIDIYLLCTIIIKNFMKYRQLEKCM